MFRNLDPSLYTDPAFFDRERRGIFARSWQHLGPRSQLAKRGDYIAADIAGAKIFVILSRDGELRGFKNVCRHRGAQLLADGAGTCATIRCPYHQWVFSDTGALVTAPWFGDDPDFKSTDWPLEPIAVAVWRGLLFAAIDPVESLTDQLGDLVQELVNEPIETYAATNADRVVFDANWKVYTDNFVEGYHIPGVHPAFFRAIDFEAFKTTAHRGFVRMTAPPREGLFYRGKWLWMWPNWTLSLFEGGMNTSRINPIAFDRTEQLYNFYFADTSPENAATREDTVTRNLAVVREDYEVCVGTHRNYASGSYRPGPLSPRHEAGVHYFQKRVLESTDGHSAKP
ncbi:MAG: Rieske 2Fe-2S domain-containing protein [Alphaproteobacteria bacterium]|nr:Rieske 2Fe-2S domain-containing protein [Alphaproteobacteria bacterium]